MKVLLVYPNMFGMNMLPTGLGLIHGSLKAAGHTVKLFDTTSYTQWDKEFSSDNLKEKHLNVRPFDDALLRQNEKFTNPSDDFNRCVREFSPDLIACSVTEDMYPNALELLGALDKDRPPVVAGGVFPTFAPELALRKAGGRIDYVLVGEGEQTLPEFCRRLERGQDVTSVEGLWFIDGKGTLHRSPMPSVVDVNAIPLPDFGLFEESRFFRPMQGKVRRMLPIETHRGCPYPCAYCNSPSQSIVYQERQQRFFRKKRMDRVRDELLQAIDRYHADSFYFWADTFLAWNDHEFEAFCEMYKDIKRPFWIQTRAETVTVYRFRKLAEAGLFRAAFGLEHGNPDFREKVLFRKITNETIINNLQLLNGLGIPFSVNNIMGFPLETRALAFDTIELNRHIRADGMNAYSFIPFHGTPLRAMAEMLGFVKPGEIARSAMKPTMLRMPHWSKDEIEGLRRCFVLYVVLPKDRWPEIADAERLTPSGDQKFEVLRQEALRLYKSTWQDRPGTEGESALGGSA